MDLEQAMTELTSREASFRRRVVAGNKVRVSGDYLVAGNEVYSLGDEETLRLICAPLHAPATYLRDLPPNLRADLIGYHLGQGKLGDGAVTVVTKDNQLVAVERGDFVQLSCADVLQAVVTGIGGDGAAAEVANLRAEPDRVTVDILSQSESAVVEPRPGDVIRAGLRVRHSLPGRFATEVTAYIERLVCRNGAVRRTCLDRKQPRTRRLPASHPEAARLQRRQIERLARSAWAALAQQLASVKELAQVRFASRDQVRAQLRALLQQNRLSTSQRDRRGDAGTNVLRRLEAAWEQEGGDLSAFGVMNAVTRLATHDPSLSDRERFALSRLGGLLAFQTHHMCPRCFSLLSRELPPDVAVPTGRAVA